MRVSAEELSAIISTGIYTASSEKVKSMARELKITRKLEEGMRVIQQECEGCRDGWPVGEHEIHEEPNSIITVGCRRPILRKFLSTLDTLEQS